MSLFSQTALAAARLRGATLALRALDPRPTQERALRHLLRRAARTSFGQKHGLARITGPASFRERMPLFRYADLAPWFARALDGEPDVTWPGVIPFFAWSSGTTSGLKHLPLSHDQIRQQRLGGFDPIASYLRTTGDAALLGGKAVLLGGSSSLERRPSGVQVGVNTGIMASHIPGLVQHLYLPSPPVRAIADWDRKLDAIAAETFDQDVRILAGVPSWFPGLFDRVLDEARRRGRPATTVADVWPNLRLMTGGGINFEPYRSLIEARLGRRATYVDVYNATEGGFLGVQDRPEVPAMVMLPDSGNYYEFIPVDELDSAAPRRLSLWEVEVGVLYALAVSTLSGVFSYVIGDCVRFVSQFPHRFTVEGRVGGFLNVTGELVSQGELERAVTHAARALHVEIGDFLVTAAIGSDDAPTAQHTFWVEFVGEAPALDRFAGLVDEDIRAGNGDYAAHRASRTSLLAPRVQSVARGTFHRFMRRVGKLGGQNKIPRIVLDPARRDAFLAEVQAGEPPSP